MLSIKEKYIVNDKGRKVNVVLDVEDYKHICKDLEELDAIRTYDRVKESEGEVIPFEQAIKEIEENR